MARFRPADLSAAVKKDREAMRINKGATMAADGFGEDPWAVVQGGDVSRESPAPSSHAVEVPIKRHESEDEEIALPTPINQGAWKITSPDGHETFVYQPIPGFEHLWNASTQSQGLPSATRPPRTVTMSTYQTPAQVPAPPRQQNLRKRTRSTARGRTVHVQDVSDDENDEQYDDRDVRTTTDTTYTFYIGDLVELKKFFHRRLDELTMKPVRPIVTAWIKLYEPKRLSLYGPYHKKLPRDMPPQCTPPWWPRDVPYEEPSHLDKMGLLTLAVDFMLQHRIIDAVKRRGSWVQKLRKIARYAVESTAADQFSSSKGSGFSETMQKRALSEILPNLFEIAQSYEDHLAQYGLYEGAGNQDPGNGTRVTWQYLTRPPRQTAPRKRVRRTKAPAAERVVSDADASGDETEVDNTATITHLRRGRRPQTQAQAPQNPQPRPGLQEPLPLAVPQDPIPQTQASQGQAPVPAHVTAAMLSQPDVRYRSAAPTPNASFGQPMLGLPLGENMDMDVKVAHRDPYQHQVPQTTFPPSQPMEYPTSHAAFNSNVLRTHHDEGHFMGSAQSSFAPTVGYEHSFSMFDPPYHPQVSDGSFTSPMHTGNGSFSYAYQDSYPPSSMPAPLGFFNGLPTHPSVSCPQEAYRH